MSIIDLRKLPAPEVVEEVRFEDVLEEMLADLKDFDPQLDISERDPAYRVLEVAAYREMLRREHDNQRVKRLLLAYATGGDLGHIGVTYFNTERLVIDEGDPDANPPEEPVMESDADYKERILLAPDGYSTAGPIDAYIYHARSADGQVKDAQAYSDEPVHMIIPVLSHGGNGEADQELLDKVEAALRDKDVRPLTDLVDAQSAIIKTYEVVAALEVEGGSDPEVVREAAEDAVREYTEEAHRLGFDVIRDRVAAELYVEGVVRVHLNLEGDIHCELTEAPFCENIEVTLA